MINDIFRESKSDSYKDLQVALSCFQVAVGTFKRSGKRFYSKCPKCGDKTFYLWCNQHGMWCASCSKANKCNHYISPKELFALLPKATPIVFTPDKELKVTDWESYNNSMIEQYITTKCRMIEDDEVASSIAIRRNLKTDNLFAQYGKIIIPALTPSGNMFGLKVYDKDNVEMKYQWKNKMGDIGNLVEVPSHMRVVGLESLQNTSMPVFLTEGTFDAHNFAQGVSYDSCGVSLDKVNFLKDTLREFKEVYWVVDRDRAGNAVAHKFIEYGIPRSNIMVTPAPYKDANEMSIKINKKLLDKSDLQVV